MYLTMRRSVKGLHIDEVVEIAGIAESAVLETAWFNTTTKELAIDVKPKHYKALIHLGWKLEM